MIISRGSIDRETGNRIAGEDVGGAKVAPPAPLVLEEQIRERKAASLMRIQETMQRALLAQLPREREVHPWEPDKLTDTHIEMIFDSIAGASLSELAAKHGYSVPRISVILNHPDAIYLKSTILAQSSDKLSDLAERLKHIAPEALNVKLDILRDSRVAAAVRDRVATDLLDRAGYAPKKEVHVEQESRHVFVMPAQAATGLAAALDEANRVQSIDYRQHLRRPQDDEVAQAADLRISAGQHEPSIKPPLDPSLGAVEGADTLDEEEPGVFRLRTA